MSNINLLMKVALVVFIILLIGKQAKSAKCDKDGKCKFGGICVKNECICKFNCKSKLWNSIHYCGLKHSRPKRFRNICELNNHACLIQQDVPIIKLKKPTKHNILKTCKVNRPKPKVKLCDHPATFLDKCNSRISNGICLENIHHNNKFCSCPSNRLGTACEFINPLTEGTKNSDIVQSNISLILLIASFLAAVLTLVFVAVWRHRKKSKKSEKLHLFKGSKSKSQTVLLLTPKNRKNINVNKNTNSNRSDDKNTGKKVPH